MPRFKVTVTSGSAVEVGQALHGSGIPTIGPAMAGFTSAPGSWTVGDHLTAVLEAENADAAVQRVEEVIGSDGEVVGGAEPWGKTTE
jgi:hypothetical protein